jgi:ribonuclease E
MFPNVRLLIAAVVASVVALSCGFAVFAVFRVNHEPLSRLAAGAAPLQLAVGNPMPSAAIPAPADSFGNRFPLNNGDAAGASAQVAPPQTERDDSVEAPSAVATTATITTTAPETEPAESAQPAPVAQTPEPDARPNEVATTTPSEPPPAAPIEAPQATTETAATEPPPEQAPPAAQTAPTEQASQESNPPTETRTATTPTAAPPPPEAPRKTAHRHRLAAKAQRARQARAIAPIVSQPAGIGGPFVPPPSRLVAMPPPPRHARATVQPVSQPSGVGGPFVPPANR